MNFNNVLKINTVKKRLQYLNVSFGDQNKKQTAQNKINVLKTKKQLFNEYLCDGWNPYGGWSGGWSGGGSRLDFG